MPVKSNNFSIADCRGDYSKRIESNEDNIIVHNNLCAGEHLKPLLWIMTGSILVIAVLGVATSQSLFLIPTIVLSLLLSIILMPRQTKTAINLADRTIRKTWKIGTYQRHAIYPLDDISSVEVKDKSRMVEGYSLPFYTVQLIGKRKQIVICSTDDSGEAHALRIEISASLNRHGLSASSTNKLF